MPQRTVSGEFLRFQPPNRVVVRIGKHEIDYPAKTFVVPDIQAIEALGTKPNVRLSLDESGRPSVVTSITETV
jgi:hypothetical protein